mmetsp:Transcript_97234/g.208580  ORF Transcript_97234/g.208580 Transcript_97234/m.208580 type:complete len:440 (+) Transcript_97234:79-1398(+)
MVEQPLLVKGISEQLPRPRGGAVPARRQSYASSPEHAFEPSTELEEELERLHMECKRKAGLVKHLGRDITDQELRAAWGQGRSWHVHAAMPVSSEQPLVQRGACLLPRSADSADEVLSRFGVGACCTKGRKRPEDTTIGQDSFSASRLPGVILSGGWEVYIVADGHGPKAHLLSDRIVRTLPYLLGTFECRQQLWRGAVEDALASAFARVEADLHNQDLAPLAGSTATCVLRRQGRKAWVAVLGDSRALLLDSRGEVQCRTVDHTPRAVAERKRVEEAGGEVRVSENVSGIGPPRVYLQDAPYPGLTVTRSFGDLMAKPIGITAEPEVWSWDVADPQGHFLVASDGVWEHFSDEEVAGLVAAALGRGATPSAALQELLTEVQQRWESFDGEYCDDITALLIPALPVAATPPKLQQASSCLACRNSICGGDAKASACAIL